MADGTVTTAPFTGTASLYVSQMARFWLAKWWWLVAVPVVACMIGAFWRWEWLIVALILVLLLYPTALLPLYFNYALSPQALETLHERQATFSSDGSLSVKRLDSPKVADYGVNDVAGATFGNKYLVLRLKTRPVTLLIIPVEAIKATELDDLHKICTNYTAFVA